MLNLKSSILQNIQISYQNKLQQHSEIKIQGIRVQLCKFSHVGTLRVRCRFLLGKIDTEILEILQTSHKNDFIVKTQVGDVSTNGIDKNIKTNCEAT